MGVNERAAAELHRVQYLSLETPGYSVKLLEGARTENTSCCKRKPRIDSRKELPTEPRQRDTGRSTRRPRCRRPGWSFAQMRLALLPFAIDDSRRRSAAFTFALHHVLLGALVLIISSKMTRELLSISTSCGVHLPTAIALFALSSHCPALLASVTPNVPALRTRRPIQWYKRGA